MKKKLKLFNIDRLLRLMLIGLCTVILFAAGFSIYRTEKFQKYITKKSAVYSYDNTARVNYQVNLLPNQLYPEKSLKEGGTYFSNLVDNIDTLFTYEFHGERAAKIKGTYNIHAILEGFVPAENGDKTLWRKDYELQPNTSFQSSDKAFSVQKKLPIDTNRYVDYATKALQITGSSFSTKITFTWNVLAEIQTDKGTKNENLVCTMTVPLGPKYFEIKGNLSKSNKGALEETIKEISPTYKTKLMLYRGLGIGCIIAILILLIFTTPKADIRPVDKKRKQMFKDHGNRMVALYSSIYDSSKCILEVLSIEDLVKIADDIERPILYKGSEDSGEIYNFYVVSEKEIYMLDIRREINF